jgi:hypothetical protein
MSKNPTHQWVLIVTKDAHIVFDTLDSSEKFSIFRRLQTLLESENPYNLYFVEKLKDEKFAAARKFRAGRYRVRFILDSKPLERFGRQYKGRLFVLAMSDRRDAYE